jgi:hypothetical protein
MIKARDITRSIKKSEEQTRINSEMSNRSFHRRRHKYIAAIIATVKIILLQLQLGQDNVPGLTYSRRKCVSGSAIAEAMDSLPLFK